MIDACSRDSNALLTVDEALERIQSAVEPITDTETIAIQKALGRVLAVTVNSPINIPFDRNAAMDGYAFNSRELQPGQGVTLTLAGTSWAGRPYQGQLNPCQCIRIFTGAVVPEQADSVVMQEQVQVERQSVFFPADIKCFQNIRTIGEDVKQGACLLRQPKILTAVDLGLLASAGIEQVTVKRQLKIAYFSTGDELISPGQPLASGKIYDSNRMMLGGLLADPCYNIVDLGVIPDQKQLLEAKILEAAAQFDVILTTGGVSVGEADYVKEILQACGNINFWKIAMKPGKPLAFGSIKSCYFFGLPGNPIAVVVTFQQIVTFALKQLSGLPPVKPLRLTAICSTPLKKAPGRKDYQRGILSQNEFGEFYVATAGQQGSNMLSAMSRSNCYIILPEACSSLQIGDQVVVEPFNLSI